MSENTNSVKFNDGLCSGGRRPRLYLAKGGEVKKFVGEAIPGFCVIVTQRFERNGKWSNTDWSLSLAPGVRPLIFLSPLHGNWGDEFTSWGEVCQKLGLPIEVAQEVVRKEYPRTGERLDQAEAFAIASEEAGKSSETVIVSFGSPTNRQAQEGFWSSPKKGVTSDGREVIVRPSEGEYGPNWSEPIVVAPEGATILSSRHRSGMKGGYYTVEVLVPSE